MRRSRRARRPRHGRASRISARARSTRARRSPAPRASVFPSDEKAAASTVPSIRSNVVIPCVTRPSSWRAADRQCVADSLGPGEGIARAHHREEQLEPIARALHLRVEDDEGYAAKLAETPAAQRLVHEREPTFVHRSTPWLDGRSDEVVERAERGRWHGDRLDERGLPQCLARAAGFELTGQTVEEEVFVVRPEGLEGPNAVGGHAEHLGDRIDRRRVNHSNANAGKPNVRVVAEELSAPLGSRAHGNAAHRSSSDTSPSGPRGARACGPRD